MEIWRFLSFHPQFLSPNLRNSHGAFTPWWGNLKYLNGPWESIHLSCSMKTSHFPTTSLPPLSLAGILVDLHPHASTLVPPAECPGLVIFFALLIWPQFACAFSDADQLLFSSGFGKSEKSQLDLPSPHLNQYVKLAFSILHLFLLNISLFSVKS